MSGDQQRTTPPSAPTPPAAKVTELLEDVQAENPNTANQSKIDAAAQALKDGIQQPQAGARAPGAAQSPSTSAHNPT